MTKEHKYKDKDDYKDIDKDKHASRITKTLTACYIFGIPVTRPVLPSTSQYSPV